MTAQPFLFITGMHRSGTSLTANLLCQSGLALGDDLLEATPDNPDGHFEHRPFVDFHDAVLGARNANWYEPPSPEVCRWTTSEDETARVLLADLVGRGGRGAKDPRATLFLHDWARICPAAHFLLVWRPASEVCDSLRRRGDPTLHRWVPFRRQMRALGIDRFNARLAAASWADYNARLAAFAGLMPERCLVLGVRSLTARFEELAVALGKRGFELNAAHAEAIVRPDRLQSTPRRGCVRANRAARNGEIEDQLAELERATWERAVP
ncbi:MAG: sulfotransferase [Planctomycetota bacterium]